MPEPRRGGRAPADRGGAGPGGGRGGGRRRPQDGRQGRLLRGGCGRPGGSGARGGPGGAGRDGGPGAVPRGCGLLAGCGAARLGSAGRGMFWAPGGPAWGTTEPGPVGLRGAQPRGAGAPGSPCTLPVRSDMHLGGRGAAYINSRTNSAGIVLANALKSYPERLVRAYRWQSETVPQVYGSLSPAQDSPNVECVFSPPPVQNTKTLLLQR